MNIIMKKVIYVFVLAFFSSIKMQAQVITEGDKVLGVWLSEEKDGKVEIYKSGNKYMGKLIWSNKMYEADGVTSKKDLKNAEEKLRNRNLKDLLLLTDFVFEDGAWTDGKIYDPKSGKTYSSTMKLQGTTLNIRGYVGISLLGRTTVWTRVK
jgi:uncharacterized protein (DUF2147 family)